MKSLIVDNRKSFCSEKEEISDNRSVLLMPGTLRDADFTGDDGEDMAPEGESGNSWDNRKRRNVIWIDPRVINHIRKDDKPNGR